MTESAETLRKKFEAAVGNNDFEAFRTQYLEFLSQFPAFGKAYSATPTDVTVHSAIFGHKLFFLKQTNDAQARDILKNGRAASTVFGALPLAQRQEFLKILEEKIDKYKEYIEIPITADTGKPFELSASEMKKGKEWFAYTYENAEAQIGPKGPEDFRIEAQPLGVAQIIGAYNYPYALAAGGIIGALAAGNGIVVSAPLKAPNWVFPFMQAAREATEEFTGHAIARNMPWADSFAAVADGLIQYSVGVNRLLTGEADLVHFVGGDATGNIISKSRGLKPTILEMGGSNVAVVMDSALDHAGAADEIAKMLYNGFVPATGQRCTAPRMLCVEKGAEAVVAALGKLCAEADHHIGNSFSKGTKMGPLVDRGARQKMEEALAFAKEVGAKIYGNIQVSNNVIPQAANDSSFWVGPVVIDWSTADLSRPENADRLKAMLGDEIFGPLLHVVDRISGIDEAIAMTNRLDTHGLAGALFTRNPDDVRKYRAGVKVTSLSINEGTKDRSPRGPHGHPGLRTIGGDDHFRLYCSKNNLVQPELKPAPAP